MTLILANPITSSLSKYYEQVKANYSRDIDHLINFNNDGLWIKETIEENKGLSPQQNLKIIF